MTSTTVERTHSLTAIADEWEDLAERSGASPFLRPGWFGAWMDAFGNGAKPLILAVREGERLTGVVPLIGNRWRLQAPVNSHTPVFDLVAEDDEAARTLARALVSLRPQQLDLKYLDASGPLLRAWGAAAPGVAMESLTQMRSPYVPLTGDFEDFRAGLTRNFRRDLDRRRRRLGELGELTFRFTDGGDDLDRALDEGFQLEASGWKLEQGTAIVQNLARVEFYRGVAHWARDQGWLTLAFACLNGRPIAFDLCIDQGGSVYVLKGGYDPKYRKYGLGFLLIEQSIKRAYRGAMNSYELLGNDDEYKLQITETVRERVHLRAFGRGPGGIARRVCYSGMRRLKNSRGG